MRDGPGKGLPYALGGGGGDVRTRTSTMGSTTALASDRAISGGISGGGDLGGSLSHLAGSSDE